MNIYITLESEPRGGFYSASTLRDVSPYAEQIRLVSDFPEEVWTGGMRDGFPVDSDGSSDTFWFPYYCAGSAVWARQSSYDTGRLN